MANTTNFGWETPDDTDLVKDGAAAMRTLGNAIDTSFVDLKGGTTGQMLTKASNTDLDYSWTTPQIGDITAVTAGTGLSGGGTSGDVTLTNTVATAYDAKGDLVVGTGADTFAKLSAGTNGYTLVADSSQTTGLAYAPTFFAGKNKIINGDFSINQRNITSTTSTGYNFDRFNTDGSGGTITTTSQTFTAGTAPVAGYEGKNYIQIDTTGQSASGNYSLLYQPIESVRTFAGQTITISFWAKAASGTPSIAVEVGQTFGTGGSPSSSVNTGTTKQAITTSWARYSYTIAVPSISGKTIGTNNNDALNIRLWLSAGSTFDSRTNTLGIQTATISIWGVQVEAGSTATQFQTATGTLQGELAACQRYYWQYVSGSSAVIANGFYLNANQARGVLQFPVTMRTSPTLTQTTGTNYYNFNNGTDDFINSITITFTTTNSTLIYNNTDTSGSSQTPGVFLTNNAASSIAFGAEL